MPGLSSIYAGYGNTAFAIEDLYLNNFISDSLYTNSNEAINNMNSLESGKLEFFYTPLFLGFWSRSVYMTFSVTEKFIGDLTTTDDMGELLWYGNTRFLGERASFDNTNLYGMHLREYSFGISKELNEKLTMGIHTKLLFGKGNFYTSKSSGGLTTNENNYHIEVDMDSEFNTSFPLEVNLNEHGYVSNIRVQDDIDWTG